MRTLHEALAAVCRLPIVYRERGDISEADLIWETGYPQHAAEITEGILEEHIRAHPELLDVWVRYSEDQRCSPAWALGGRDTVGDPTREWHVSYWDRNPANRSHQVFPDQFSACAFFVKQQADSLMRIGTLRRSITPITPGPFDDVARDATSVEDALNALHEHGASPATAIKALIMGRGVSLRDAKLALHRSPAWARVLWKELADAWEIVELQELEAALGDAILKRQDDPRELLERLVDALLTGPAGLEYLDTDGLVVSLDRKSENSYLAVGHVWTLQQSREPVHIQMAFSPGGSSMRSGEVHFGLSPFRASPSMSQEKARRLLIAYPEEAPHLIPWSYSFRREAGGWTLVALLEELSEDTESSPGP